MPRGVYDRTLAPGYVPAWSLDWLINDLRIRYGSLAEVGRAYEMRYNLRPGSGQRLIYRITSPTAGVGVECITWNTLDRLKTLAAS